MAQLAQSLNFRLPISTNGECCRCNFWYYSIEIRESLQVLRNTFVWPYPINYGGDRSPTRTTEMLAVIYPRRRLRGTTTDNSRILAQKMDICLNHCINSRFSLSSTPHNLYASASDYPNSAHSSGYPGPHVSWFADIQIWSFPSRR